MPFGPIIVTTAGTPVLLVSELITLGVCLAGDVVQINKLYALPIPTNNGSCYIGLKTMNKATLQGVIGVVPPGAGAGFTIIHNVGMNIYQAQQLYVDADNSGEGIGGAIDQV